MKMAKQNLEVVILAAGLGTRMKSATIKILHRAAGRPIIDYVLDLAADLTDAPPVMVVGHQRDAVQEAVGGARVSPFRSSNWGQGTRCCRPRRFSRLPV